MYSKYRHLARAAAACLAALAVVPASAGAASSATVLPLPPLPPLPNPLPNLPIDTANLSLEYVTSFKPASGADVVKRFTATLAIPRQLDVDGNGTTDLTANVSLAGDSSLRLVFTRPSTATGKLPVSVEAVANDPTQDHVLPRAKVAFGYDGRADTAPRSWTSIIKAGSESGATSVDVTTTTSGAGTSLRTLGGLFDGDALSRSRPLGGGIKYTPVPASTTLGLTLSPSAAEVRAGSGTPVTATADVEIGQGASRRIVATVQKLPASLRLRHDSVAKTVRYSASAAVASLGLRFIEGGTRTWILNATGLPQDIGIASNPATGRTSMQVASGAIASATVGVATGEPELLDLDQPYANVTPTSAAVRLDHIEQVVVDNRDGVGVEVMLTSGAATKFRTIASLTGKYVDGQVSNLPAHFRVAYTPSLGRAFYNGYDTTIASADVGMQSSAPFFGRVTRIKGHLEGLPTSVTINLKKAATGAGAGFTASPRVGLVEASFRSPVTIAEQFDTIPLAAGQSGAYLRDVPTSPYWAFVRLRNVTSGELSQVDGRLKATLGTAPVGDDYQDVRLLALLNKADDAVAADATITATIRDLPPLITVEQTAEWITFTGNRAIPFASLSARNLPVGNAGESLRGKIHNVEATVTSLPARFTVEYGPTAQGFTAPSGYFGQIDFAAWDDTGQPASSDEFANLVKLDRRDGKLSVWGRIHGARTAIVRGFFGITQVEAAFGAPQSHVEFQLADGYSDDPVDLTAALLPSVAGGNIPTSANLQFVTPPHGVHMIWQANTSSLLYVTMSAKEVSINNLQVRVPPSAEICFGAGRYNCDPQTAVTYSGVPVDLPNKVTLVTKALSPLTVSGHICMRDGDQGVYGNCPGTGKYVLIDQLRMQTARIELAKETDSGYLYDDEYLKLHLDTDSYGILARSIRIKSDSDITLRAAKPIRNVTAGEPFTGVSQLGGVADDADSEYRASLMTCDGLSIEAHTSVGDLSARSKVIPSSWCA